MCQCPVRDGFRSDKEVPVPVPRSNPNGLGFLGEKKKLWSVSLKPSCERFWGCSGEFFGRSGTKKRSCCETIGTIVRKIRFQFLLIEIGITG
jgi:hypothetical protein